MALDAEKRIPDTTLPANSFKDGDILYGSDMNRVVDTLKTAVNENYKDLKGAVKGGDDIYIEPIEGVVDSEGQPIDTVDGLIKWLYDNKVLNEGDIQSLRINDLGQFEYYDGESWKLATVGQQGDPGEGVPTGGLSGQFLRKQSDVSYDTEWVDAYDKEQVDSKINNLTTKVTTNTNDIDNIKFGENSLSKNLVDWSKASHTMHEYGNGNIIYNNNYYGVLDYFETKGQKLTLSFNITSNVTNPWCAITLYDENKNYLRNVSSYGQELSVIPNSNEKYATFVLYSGNTSLSKDDYYNVQLEYGDRTSYEPYIPSLKKLNKLNQRNTVILGTSWTHDTANGYYTQSIICSGITSDDNPTVDVNLSGTLENMESQQEEWGKILKVETSTDTLKFYASEPTSIELSVMVKGV